MHVKTIIAVPSRQCGKTQRAEITEQTAALAARLEANVSPAALAHEIANREVIRGLVAKRSAAQIEADLLAQLRRHEVVCALRRHGRGSHESVKS